MQLPHGRSKGDRPFLESPYLNQFGVIMFISLKDLQFLCFKLISPNPQVPFDEGQFHGDLSTDKATSRLFAILNLTAPHIISLWNHAVIPAANRSQEIEIKLEKKDDELLKIAEEAASEEAAIIEIGITATEPVLKLPAKPIVGKFEFFLSVGLGFMLFLALCDYMGLNITNIAFNRAKDWVLLVIAISVSTCITITIKKSLKDWVIYARHNEPQRRYQSGFTDDNLFAHSVAFWKRFWRGEAACWAGLGVVFLEMLFAAPGLLGMLPPSLQDNLLSQLTAFAAAGLAAYANVLYAWAGAFNHLQYESECVKAIQKHEEDCMAFKAWKKSEEENLKLDPEYSRILNQNQEHRQKYEAAKERKQRLFREVQELKQALAQSRIEATNEYERFFAAYRKLLKDNPNMVREFNELYPMQPYLISPSSSTIESLNGHKKFTSPILPISLETRD
jgi:hypothetical protein